MKTSKTSLKLKTLMFVLFFLITSCATYHNQKVPMLGKDDINAISEIGNGYKKKPIVFLKIKKTIENENNYIPISQIKYQQMTTIFQKSNLFSEVIFNPSDIHRTNFIIEILLHKQFKKPKTAGFKIICLGSSFLIIPASFEEVYSIKMHIIDHKGKIINKYFNEDSATIWYGLFCLPFGSKRLSYDYLYNNLLAHSLLYLSKSYKYLECIKNLNK